MKAKFPNPELPLSFNTSNVHAEIGDIVQNIAKHYDQMEKILTDVCSICFDEQLTEEEKYNKLHKYIPIVTSSQEELAVLENQINKLLPSNQAD